MRPVFLIGYMCSGKTTLGRALAAALGCEFIDLDHYIEAQAGMKVREIFATQGESAFRKMEREALAQASSKVQAVIACGGGTPCAPGAMDLMNSLGVTVCLKPLPHRLLQRLMHGRHKRPLIANIQSEEEMMAFANAKMSEREPYYNQAQYQFDSSWLENKTQIDRTIQDFLAQIPIE